MALTELIDEYITAAPAREPLFADEIFSWVRERMPGAERATFNEYLVRCLKKSGELKRFRRGIYYKSVKTPLGTAGIDKSALVRKLYISDGKSVYGYETGASLMNRLGLTSRMPAHIHIATERFNYRLAGEPLVLTKPIVKIDKDDHRYLQLLDMLAVWDEVGVDAVDPIAILRTFIVKNGLKFEKLLYYAGLYDNVAIYKRLAKLAREKV